MVRTLVWLASITSCFVMLAQPKEGASPHLLLSILWRWKRIANRLNQLGLTHFFVGQGNCLTPMDGKLIKRTDRRTDKQNSWRSITTDIDVVVERPALSVLSCMLFAIGNASVFASRAKKCQNCARVLLFWLSTCLPQFVDTY